MKRLLVTDVDGVLVDYNEGYRRHWEKRLGRPIEEKDPSAYWALDRYDVPVLQGEELQDFRDSFKEEFWESLEALGGAVEAYEKLSEHYTIVACTASDPKYNEVRQNHLRSIGFKDIVVHSVGQNPDPQINPKADIINSLKPDVVVDDYPLGLMQLWPECTKFLIARNSSDKKHPQLEMWFDLRSLSNLHIFHYFGRYTESGLQNVYTHLTAYKKVYHLE